MKLILDRLKKKDPRICFIIQRSLNKNIVVYRLNDNTEIYPYWLMLEKHKESSNICDNNNMELNLNTIPTEDLNFLEKTTAYGVNQKKINENKLLMNIISYKKIPIEITQLKNNIQTKIILENKKYDLIGIFIHQNKYNLLRPVEGITIYFVEEENIKSRYIKH